jgi:hypothetical protein
MDSKRILPILAILLLAACTSATGGNSPWDYGKKDTYYWYQRNITADNVPNIIKAQDILEEDLMACGYEKRARNYMAAMNDPISTPNDGQVVDEQGAARDDTPLPVTYRVRDCMDRKGWVPLKHYYSQPY